VFAAAFLTVAPSQHAPAEQVPSALPIPATVSESKPKTAKTKRPTTAQPSVKLVGEQHVKAEVRRAGVGEAAEGKAKVKLSGRRSVG
jgi:hypothetical protein